jgi:hypothetical protein
MVANAMRRSVNISNQINSLGREQQCHHENVTYQFKTISDLIYHNLLIVIANADCEICQNTLIAQCRRC